MDRSSSSIQRNRFPHPRPFHGWHRLAAVAATITACLVSWVVPRACSFVVRVGPATTAASGYRRPPSFLGVIDAVIVDDGHSHNGNDDDDDDDDDDYDDLVTPERLAALCEQWNLSSEGSLEDLLGRLRSFAKERVEADQERRKLMVNKAIDEGLLSSKHDVPPEALEGVFYYPAVVAPNKTATISPATELSEAPLKEGPKVTTVYDSRETNDLSGWTQRAPGYHGGGDHLGVGSTMNGGTGPSTTSSYFQKSSNQIDGSGASPDGNNHNKEDEKERERQEDEIVDLLYALLRPTGLKGFQDYGGLSALGSGGVEGEDDVIQVEVFDGYEPFDPSSVSTALLDKCTCLKSCAEDVLDEALYRVEMQAVGHDGRDGDDVEGNGGHYREVQRAGAFLRGYRASAQRARNREMVCGLLDSLVKEGLTGLDQALAMAVAAKSVDDSLLKYLDGLTREQERRVEQAQSQPQTQTTVSPHPNVSDDEDETRLQEVARTLESWNVTRDEEGKIIEESIDPNDPRLRDLLFSSPEEPLPEPESPPITPQQQTLLLLRLLRERIKAEAAFLRHPAGMEHGRRLRLLAYCVHARDSGERRQLLEEGVGSSLEGLQAFAELLQGSIEYALQQQKQPQPSLGQSQTIEMGGSGRGGGGSATVNQRNVLDLDVLRDVQRHVRNLREIQALRAAGRSDQVPKEPPFLDIPATGSLSP